ncbi:MAG: DoxX family protein [Bacteroidales bacterium]|nr:DoxX family protein [Bacteroidales bacterium]
MKHNALRRTAASVIGLVFVASGLLKMLDVTGTGLIVSEYFKFFHLGGLTGISKATAVILCLVETLTGAALLTGVFRKLTAIIASALTLGFTIITLILLIKNPQMDCGCFGEAVHLTHLQSFLKNIVLLLLCLLAFLPFKEFGEPKNHRKVAFWIAAVSIALASFYSATHLPALDFTDFRPGAQLYASLDNDYQAMDGYYAAYIYEKDGQKGSFTLDRLPDSTWTFVKVDTVYRNSTPLDRPAPILSFTDDEGNYRDEDAVIGKVMLISVYNPEKCDWMRLNVMLNTLSETDIRPLILINTAPGSSIYIPSNVAFFYADYKTLITLNRANGGATFLADGEIARKWRPADFPSIQKLNRISRADVTDTQIKSVTPGRIRAEGFALYLLAVLIFL